MGQVHKSRRGWEMHAEEYVARAADE
jgi:hypothetical protein